MATIVEKTKDGKIVSFKIMVLLGRDEKNKQRFKCKTWYPEKGMSKSQSIENVEYLDDGDEVVVTANPEAVLKVTYTPGHTTDSVTFYSEKDLAAFVGDTIFKGRIGNYQYPGGDALKLEISIAEKILTLPDDTVLFSGHSEQTTVGAEKQMYWLQRRN